MHPNNNIVHPSGCICACCKCHTMIHAACHTDDSDEYASYSQSPCDAVDQQTVGSGLTCNQAKFGEMKLVKGKPVSVVGLSRQ